MSHPELKLHISVVAQIRRCAPDVLFFHVPNGGYILDKRQVAKLKAQGLLPGAPDLVFVIPGGEVGFIELKAEGGTLTPAQEEFQGRCIELGARYVVARSPEEVFDRGGRRDGSLHSIS